MTLCGVASLEMGIRSYIDWSHLSKLSDDQVDELKKARDDLSADLSGFLVLGLCATNLWPGFSPKGSLERLAHYIPGLATGAAVYFIIRSFKTWCSNPEKTYRDEEYWVGRAVMIFPDLTYRGYECIKDMWTLPSHSSWYFLIGVVALIGYYQLGGAVSSGLRWMRDSVSSIEGPDSSNIGKLK